jgi:hypothetical protein
MSTSGLYEIPGDSQVPLKICEVRDNYGRTRTFGNSHVSLLDEPVKVATQAARPMLMNKLHVAGPE